MKKLDSKKIILSVLLGSMMWSNSLYAHTLTEDISEDEIDKNTNFKEVIIAGNESGIYQPANGEKLTISGVTTDVKFTNVEKIENSTIEEMVMGGYVNDASNNKMEIINSTIDNATGGSGFSNIDNNIVTLDNSVVTTTVVGGLGTSDGGLLTGEIVDTITANGNKVTVNGGDVNSVYGGSVALVLIGSASNLEANNNITEIKNYGEKDKLSEAKIFLGGTVTAALVDIDEDVKWDSSNNSVNIDDSYFEIKSKGLGILGGAIEANLGNSFSGFATANNNTINIKNSIIDAENASMGITAGYVSEVSSGEFTGLTSANENTINIENSTITGAIIAGRNDKGQADGNTVTVTNSAINGVIAGAFAAGSSASNNTVELNDTNNLLQSSIFGWYGEKPSEGFVHENNRLVINNFNGAVGGIANFNNMIFNDIEWNTDPSVEIVFDNNKMMLEYKIDGGILAPEISNIDAVEIGNLGNSKIETGDKAWLIFTTDDSKNEIAKFDKQEFKNYTGVAKIVNGNLVYEDSVEMTLTGSYGDEVMNQTETVGALSAVVTGVERNPQTDLVASNRAVAAAFVNQGTDLIADSLDTLSRDGKYGVKTFAAVHGNRSKYDVNSDIKINGWSTIVGVGSETEHNGGDFSWGVFYENGSGNYRTFNSFNNEYFRGDGSLVYNGGGIAARYENAHGVYTEGSLRAGMLKSDMDNALSDGENKYGYSSESEYYGAHIGIGQIIPLSESSDLDVYGKFFHTYTEGDSFTVGDTDEFEFDSINSDRLRVGARLTTNKENKFSTYYGLAYEYEFNGDAEMRAAGMSAPTQSLQGSSYMAEVGFNYQPTPESPWSFDLNMRGYAGEREGATFNVQATYTF